MIDRNVVFIRTGKVAGTSIEVALGGEMGYETWGGGKFIRIKPEKGYITEIQSDQISYMIGLKEFKANFPEIWGTAFKFMAVRNPYDRFVSAWKFLPLPEDPHEAISRKNTRAIRYHLTRPQMEGLELSDIDYFIHFENLEEDFWRLCNIIDIPRQYLGIHRTSEHNHFTEYYDYRLASKVYEMFERDFKLLGYDKDSWKR